MMEPNTFSIASIAQGLMLPLNCPLPAQQREVVEMARQLAVAQMIKKLAFPGDDQVSPETARQPLNGFMRSVQLCGGEYIVSTLGVGAAQDKGAPRAHLMLGLEQPGHQGAISVLDMTQTFNASTCPLADTCVQYIGKDAQRELERLRPLVESSWSGANGERMRALASRSGIALNF